MQNAEEGWPAAASHTLMSAEAGSLPWPGRRCFRSPRTDRLQRTPPSLNKNAADHDGPAAGTGTSRRRSGVHHGHPEGEVLLLARHVVHLRHRRSEEHTSELQSLMRISYAVFCLKKKKISNIRRYITHKT